MTLNGTVRRLLLLRVPYRDLTILLVATAVMLIVGQGDAWLLNTMLLSSIRAALWSRCQFISLSSTVNALRLVSTMV